MLMTSSMTSQQGFKDGPLYHIQISGSLLNQFIAYISQTRKDICTKSSQYMYHIVSLCCVVFGFHDAIDDVKMCKKPKILKTS